MTNRRMPHRERLSDSSEVRLASGDGSPLRWTHQQRVAEYCSNENSHHVAAILTGPFAAIAAPKNR